MQLIDCHQLNFMNTDLKERDTTNSATLYVIYIILVVNIILISLLNSIYI